MKKNEPIYIQLYMYYRELIIQGTIEKGVKLPSIRRCAAERCVSRTTVEAAYMQLAAEGYVLAKPGSGFYVSELDYDILHEPQPTLEMGKEKVGGVKYDFSSATVDHNSFNFDVWRRYIKSALRNTERLLSYGDVQGEYDLRVALCHYIRDKRGVVCTPEQIVVGAGMQTLLHLLCTLVETTCKVAFTGNKYRHGKIVFEDRGYSHCYEGTFPIDLEKLQAENTKIIYTSPSHITPWGDVMPMQDRLSLLSFVRENECLIIEDDYDSEFNYYSRPTPSLQGIDGGQNVVYMSTFSKLLLPSLRMSFMVLPVNLLERYRQKGVYYNQTASKTEQIALCQFIRDGHLEKQIKKARKLYMYKMELIIKEVQELFGERATAKAGSSGFLMRIDIQTHYSEEEVCSLLDQEHIKVRTIEKIQEGVRLIISCSSLHEDDIINGISCLRRVIL